jgi:type IV pilus assembly protein PilF
MKIVARSFWGIAAAAALAVLVSGCASNERPGAQLRGDKQTNAEKAGELNKQLGTEYFKKGNLPLAKEKLERAEKYNPRDPEIHSVLAVLYDRLGLPDEVDKHFREAIRLAPKDPQIANNYGAFLCQHGRTDEGVKRFLESAVNPLYRTPEFAYSNAGVCLRAAKRYDEAANSFARAIQIRPNYAEAVFQAADLELERGDVAKASALVDKYMGAFDATPDLLYVGVKAARKRGDRAVEDKYMRKLRVEYPGSPQFRELSQPAAAGAPGH